ncbi:protein BIIDXI-like [Typha latifolia]|uniref:protein BIIDXI-like n=1 Tax=Typha latifolia TaxID=4733 RepID=UPI003C2D977F
MIHNPGVEEDPTCGPLVDSVAIRTLYPPPLTDRNVLKNGDFEEGPFIFSNTSWGVLIPPNAEDVHSPLPSWSVVSSTSKSAKYVDSAHYAVPRGNRAVELVAGEEAALAQVARTAPGTTYAMTFSVGDAGDGCGGPMAVKAFAARGMVRIPYESKGKGGFKRAVLRFTAEEEKTRVVFTSSYYHTKIDGSLCGPVVDDVILLTARSPARRLL